MRAGFHLFVVDKYSLPVHTDRLFCGVKHPFTQSNRFGVYADLLATRPGDTVFFYQRRVDEAPSDRGFRGVYRVVGPPFVDQNAIPSGSSLVLGKCPKCGAPFSEKSSESADGSYGANCPVCKGSVDPTQHILPNRLPLELVTYYTNPVDDNTAYIDKTDPGSLWSLVFRKQYGPGRERSINHMLPEEGEKILRLLARLNPGGPAEVPAGFPAGYPTSPVSPLPFALPKKAPFSVESTLYAWLNQNIDSTDPTLRRVLGPPDGIEYFANQILYGIGGDTADYLVLHTKEPGQPQSLDETSSSSFNQTIVEQGGRFAVSVIEIKKDRVDLATLKQVDRYAYYVAQVASANCLPAPPASLLVRPILLGYGAEGELIGEIRRRGERKLVLTYPDGHATTAVVTPPRVLAYSLSGERLQLTPIV